jgi:hypothetical protein
LQIRLKVFQIRRGEHMKGQMPHVWAHTSNYRDMPQIGMKPAVNGPAIIEGVNHKTRSLRIELSPNTTVSKSKPRIDHKIMDNLFQTLHLLVRTTTRTSEPVHQCQVVTKNESSNMTVISLLHHIIQ